MNPDFYILQSFLALSHYAHGQYEEAASAFERAVAISDRVTVFVAYLAMTYEQTGRKIEAEGLWRELEERAQREYVPPVCFFLKPAARGNLRQALRWLERAGEDHDCLLSWFRVVPKEKLRGPGEATIKAWLKKVVVKMVIGWIMARHRIAGQTP